MAVSPAQRLAVWSEPEMTEGQRLSRADPRMCWWALKDSNLRPTD